MPDFEQLCSVAGGPSLRRAMFPILVWMYTRLARREERDVRAEFGETYARSAAAPPAFLPRVRRAAARRT